VTIYNSVLKRTAVVLMHYLLLTNLSDIALAKVYTAFLDASKAFNKVLHNGLFMKMLRCNIPACLVTLLMFWYSHLQCSVRWNDELGESFSILCGVCQGSVLSLFCMPYM